MLLVLEASFFQNLLIFFESIKKVFRKIQVKRNNTVDAVKDIFVSYYVADMKCIGEPLAILYFV